MKIKVTNIHQAQMILEYYNIKTIAHKDEIMVTAVHFQQANSLLENLKPKPKPKKERAQETYTGRPTFESLGKRRRAKISATIDACANDWIGEYAEHYEVPSHTLNRIILEHKALIELAEIEK